MFQQIVKVWVSVVVILLVSPNLWGQQVVNVESQRMRSEEDGWSGSLEFRLNFIKNQNEIIQGGNRAQGLYKKEDLSVLLINDLDVIRVNQNNLLNSGYQHVRYNYRHERFLTSEAFAQVQFNGQSRLQFRSVAGLGPRFTLLQRDSINLYVGTLVMQEYEVIDNREEVNNDSRFSNYMAFDFEGIKNANLDLILYYQPRVRDFDDYRVSVESRLSFKINELFTFRLAYSLLHDTEPPKNVPKTFYNFRNTLLLSF